MLPIRLLLCGIFLMNMVENAIVRYVSRHLGSENPEWWLSNSGLLAQTSPEYSVPVNMSA